MNVSLRAGNISFVMAGTRFDPMDQILDIVGGWLGPHGDEILVRRAPPVLIQAKIVEQRVHIQGVDLQGDVRFTKSFKKTRRVTVAKLRHRMSRHAERRPQSDDNVVAKNAQFLTNSMIVWDDKWACLVTPKPRSQTQTLKPIM